MSNSINSLARVCVITMVLSSSSWALTNHEAKTTLTGRWEHTARENKGKHLNVLGYAKTDVIVFREDSLEILRTNYHLAPDGVCLVGNHRQDNGGSFSYTLSGMGDNTYRLNFSDASGGMNWAIIRVGTNAFGHSVIAVRWRGARTVDYYRKV